MRPAEVRTIQVGEVRLRTSVRGSGRPLLLITGLGASLELAESFERELAARGRQVISFDAPGIGDALATDYFSCATSSPTTSSPI